MLQLRPVEVGDIPRLTRLLHAAYAELGAAGLNFTAVDQSYEVTARRINSGSTWVAEAGGRLAATVTLAIPPSSPLRALSLTAAAPRTAWLNQLAVHPDHRGAGWGRALFERCVREARARGAERLGLDTAEPAEHLRAMCNRWGFEGRESIHWEGKTYDSRVMSLDLAGASVGTTAEVNSA
ncbi:GNAT family N-acetyltransferase [Yonghaparkia sp. Root332]|uniref:GNAT family N-acetyltransferase n=1 Tax=Yonghaparkia sp. Root332 TaxID=1736516 RepID=UPI0006F1E134|nr:GNAT family N-acetyltransferase [Yonghaparkia sp. Root332]KQV26437.1 hypothetical protein ASC54_06030 [Yonghaparkia sp. Root332]